MREHVVNFSIGEPFDVTNEHYQLDFPTALKQSKDRNVRTLSTTKPNQILNNNDFKSFFLTVKNEPSLFACFFNAHAIDVGDELTDIKRAWSEKITRYQQAGAKTYHRSMSYLNPSMVLAWSEFFYDQPQRLALTWIGQFLADFGQSKTNDFVINAEGVDKRLDITSHHALLKHYLIHKNDAVDTLFLYLNTRGLLHPVNSPFGDITSRSAVRACKILQNKSSNKDNVKKAVLALWCLSFLHGCQEIFLLACCAYPYAFTEKEFPNLNHRMIKQIVNKMQVKMPKFYNLTPIEYHIRLMCYRRIIGEHVMPMDVDTVAALHYTYQMLHKAIPDKYFNIIAQAPLLSQLKDIGTLQDQILSSSLPHEIKTTVSTIKNALEGLSLDDKLDLSPSLTSEYLTALKSTAEQIAQLCCAESEIADTQEKLNKAVAGGVLEHLDEINVLAAKIKSAQAKIDAWPGSVSDNSRELSAFSIQIEQFISSKSSPTDPTNNNESKGEHLELLSQKEQELSFVKETLNHTQQELLLLRQDNEAITTKCFTLGQQLAALQSAPTLQNGDSALEHAFALLSAPSPIAYALDLLRSTYPERIEISKDAITGANEIRQFTRWEDAIKKLHTLCSVPFLTAFSQKGSQAAFAFFTKKELSFQESETTLNNKSTSRFFRFDDGEKQCKMHLRFGINNTEQAMLRIYFTIENGKVFIGSITRHLPVGTIK